MRGFHWILPGKLAGAVRPGLLDALDHDVALLKARGIRLVVSLTEIAPDPPLSQFGLPSLHFPIDDMGIPTPRDAAELVRKILASIEAGEPVLVHCKAGLGRTGTILACCLVALGRSAEEAVRELRRINHGYIQTTMQEKFVGDFADFLLGVEAEPAPALPPLRLPAFAVKPIC